MTNVLKDEYIRYHGILEEQQADMVSRSQEGITEEVMFREHLGGCRNSTGGKEWAGPNLQHYHFMGLLSFSFFSSFKYFLCLLLASQMFSRKPYREKEFGTSSLRLLSALHPITSLHPVIHYNIGQLWMKVIPQMLQILDGKRLVRRGRNEAEAVADSKKDGVLRYRMDLSWGEENWSQSLCPFETLLDGSAFGGNVLN